MSKDPEDSTKVGGPAENQASSPPNGNSGETADPAENSEEETSLLSLEEMDALLAQDADFSQSLSQLGPNEEIMMGLDEEDFALPQDFAEEVKYWKLARGRRSRIYHIFPPIVVLSYIWRTLRMKSREFKVWALDFAVNFGPNTLKVLKRALSAAKENISEAMRSFRYFKPLKKLAVFGFIFLIIGSGFVVYRVSTKGLLPPQEELFIGSMEEWAEKSYSYNPETETEAFYESTHNSQNMISLTKMVVNLKRSAGSGPNPMGAFEFYVEGTASDVLVEIKDREGEVRDLFQRNLEDMNFDQVASPEGKQLLTEKLRKEVNKILSRGKVRRVFIKAALIKP